MDDQDRFEQLKAKFQPALDFLESRHARIQTMNVQDNRLLVRAVASSEQVRDEIVGQFRRLDPSLNDVHPDIRIDSGDNVPFTGQSSVQK